MATLNSDFPAPFRFSGRLVWDRHEIENYKRKLLGLEPLERDTKATIAFVGAKQLISEFPYGRRTIGRMVRGREHGKEPSDAELSAAEHQPRSTAAE